MHQKLILCLDVHCEIKQLNKLYPIPFYNRLELFYNKKYSEEREINVTVIYDHNFEMNIIDCNWHQGDFDDDCKLNNMDELD